MKEGGAKNDRGMANWVREYPSEQWEVAQVHPDSTFLVQQGLASTMVLFAGCGSGDLTRVIDSQFLFGHSF
jgi:hypothetical protein